MTDDIDKARNQSNLHELERLAREARERGEQLMEKAMGLQLSLETAIAERDDWTRVAGHLGDAYQKACAARDEAREDADYQQDRFANELRESMETELKLERAIAERDEARRLLAEADAVVYGYTNAQIRADDRRIDLCCDRHQENLARAARHVARKES